MSSIGDGSSKDSKSGKSNKDSSFGFDDEKPRMILRNNDVDDGVIAFGMWLNVEVNNEDESKLPVIVKKFVPDEMAILFDNTLKKDVSVIFTEGIPSCRECGDLQDCAHVGFAICLEQRCRRSGLE